MSTESCPIVVGVDGSPGADDALRWAVEDARVHQRILRVVYAYYWAPSRTPLYIEIPETEVELPRRVAEQTVAKAVERIHELAPDAEVTGEAVDGDPVDVLLDESTRASLLVLGSRHRKMLGSTVLGSVSAAVAARADCPAIVMRGPADRIDEDAAVVVGVDGTDWSDLVLGFGFEHASQRYVPVRVVLCWHRATMWQVEPLPRAEIWLSETLAGWRLKYPNVPVHLAVVREHPVKGLVQLSAGQRLLVVGSRGRTPRVGTLLGSVSQGVLHHATCPVAVVPTHPRR